VRAEWASLRMKELAQWARRAEADDPLRARQMWRRLLCIDPANDEALAGVLRAKAVRVHRPTLVVHAPPIARAPDAFASLDAPIGLVTEGTSAAREERSQSEFRELRSAIGALDAQVRAAQFERAIAAAPALRSRLARAPRGGTRTSLIAQAEVLVATRRDRARSRRRGGSELEARARGRSAARARPRHHRAQGAARARRRARGARRMSARAAFAALLAARARSRAPRTPRRPSTWRACRSRCCAGSRPRTSRRVRRTRPW
jgi:hypothetical protein